jgi:hypothetical protein
MFGENEARSTNSLARTSRLLFEKNIMNYKTGDELLVLFYKLRLL